MASVKRTQHGANTKAAVALAMIQQKQTVAQICIANSENNCEKKVS